jgi:amidase
MWNSVLLSRTSISMSQERNTSIKHARGDDGITADLVSAFCGHGPRMLRGKAGCPLSALGFGAKDLFDVQGFVTGCGSPDWLRTHSAATQTAPAIEALLEAGATLVGKTQMDELAFSLNGENAHYGTPVNIRAAQRIPGGSSSGSAAAVAAQLVECSLGTDTGGSVRIPASYCGIYGIRPTHGRLSLAGCMPFAPSFDTVGWFADTARILGAVGEVLFQSKIGEHKIREVLIATDLFSEASLEVREHCAEAVNLVREMFSTSRDVQISSGLADWAHAMRILLGAEAWNSHRDWITQQKPDLGPDTRQRFTWASTITRQEINAAMAVREQAISRVEELLGDDRIMIFPTAPSPALPLQMPREQLELVRARIQKTICTASLCGVPQVSLPLLKPGSLPLGLSLLGPRHSDESLLAIATLIENSSRCTDTMHT